MEWMVDMIIFNVGDKCCREPTGTEIKLLKSPNLMEENVAQADV